jgi:hypothetical protein
MEAYKNTPVDSAAREGDEEDGKIISVEPPRSLLGYYVAECNGYPWRPWAYRPSEYGADGWQVVYDKRADAKERMRQLRRENYQECLAAVVRYDQNGNQVPTQTTYHTGDGELFGVVVGKPRGRKVPWRMCTAVRARSILLDEEAQKVPVARLERDPRVNEKWVAAAIRRLAK